jgi:hypothetical protein
MKNLSYAVLLGIIFLGCIPIVNGQTVSGYSNPGIEKEIDAVFMAAIQAAESFDATKLISCVDDRYQAGFISNGVYFTRFDSLANTLNARTPGSVKQHITIQKKKISVIADNIALVSASGVSQIEANGGNPFEVNFCWTFVYQKFNNEWKVIQSHQSGK